MESIRREKILVNLRTSLSRQLIPEASPEAETLRHKVLLAMDSISTIHSCETTMESIKSAPGGLAWVRVSTNLKAPDNYKDKFFVPYLGESDAQQNFSNAVAADADQGPAEQFPEDDISDVENTIRVTPVEVPEPTPGKDNRVQRKKLPRSRDFRGSTISRGGNASIRKSAQSVWDRAASRIALERLMQTLSWKDIQSSAAVLKQILGMHSLGEIESCHRNIIYRLQAYKEDDDEELLRHSQKKELLKQLSGSVRKQPAQSLCGDSIPFFFCRQCYIYNCLEHGTQTAKPAKEPPDRTKKAGATRQGAEDIESRCPDKDFCQCWCISRSSEDAAKWWCEMQENIEGRDAVKAVILELFASFGKDPCRISELGRLFIGDDTANRLTCHRVGYLLDTLAEAKVKNNQYRQTTRRARKKYRTKAPRGETESMKGGQRVDYAPCQHDGPCTAKTCRCVENGVNCEKYCSCNHNRVYSTRPDKRLPCNHAFQGCTCRSAIACISNACVCYSYGRECDPDLCRACFDCRDNGGARSCRNVGLLLGERQRTVVGRSDTHGWGAFAANDIGKGEIIGEYVGEIVSHIEADRRGRLYDEIDYSFLFNITEDWALDSTRLGNKLRYCNHHFKPNCNAKLMRVGGDVRVGLYAVRDIGRHEELFFDYKYKNGPAWSMPGSEGKGHSHRKQEASAKKRALAVKEDDEDDDNEVISLPKKRVKSERNIHVPPRDERNVIQVDGASYSDMNQSIPSGNDGQDLPDLTSSAKKLSTGRPTPDGKPTLTMKTEAHHSREGTTFSIRNGLVRSVATTGEHMLEQEHSERRVFHQKESPDSRKDKIPVNISQNVEQETYESPTLRDVFGSDLESLDENVNQPVGNHSSGIRPEGNPKGDAGVNNASLGSALALKGSPHNRNVVANQQTQRKGRASLTRAESDPNDQKLDTGDRDGKSAGPEKYLTVAGTQQKTTSTSLNDRHLSSRHSPDERQAQTDARLLSSIDVDRATKSQSIKSTSAVPPQINLVSDDGEVL